MITIFTQGKSLFTAPWFLIVMAVILVLVVVYIILMLLYPEETETVEKGQTFSGYVSGIEESPRFLPSRKEVREEMRPFKKRNSRKWLFRFFFGTSLLYMVLKLFSAFFR